MWLLFSLDGRVPRLYYWIVQIALFVTFRFIMGMLKTVHAGGESHAVSPNALLPALVVILIAFVGLGVGLWVGFAIVVKRWHDRGRSWAWALLGFVPIVGWLWQGIECGFLEGTLGPNRFGPSPKGISAVLYGDPLAETFA